VLASTKAAAKALTGSRGSGDSERRSGSRASKRGESESTNALAGNARRCKSRWNPWVPLELDANAVQPEGQLKSTAKEVVPAIVVDMAAVIAVMQSMHATGQRSSTHDC
jgi:hypothetical protein